MINMAEYSFTKKFQREATVNKFSKRLSCMFFTFREDRKRDPSFYVEI